MRAPRKFEVTFIVEVKAEALPADDDSAAADVVELVQHVWDGDEEARASKQVLVDSYNFIAEAI